MRGFPIVFSAILVPFAMAGCAAYSPASRPDISLEFSRDDSHFIPSSLAATSRQFFGGSTIAPPGTVPRRVTGAGRLIDIDEDTLSAAGGVPFTRESSTKVRVRLGREQPLGDHLAVTGGISLGHGTSRYLLPRGAGVLTDPIRIRFATTSLEVDAGIAVFTSDRLQSRAEVGIGKTWTRTQTGITSALLNVRNTNTHAAGFVYTGIRLGLRPRATGKPQPRLSARIKYYLDGDLSVRSGIALGF